MDKGATGTTMMMGGGATGVTAAKLDAARSILDIPLVEFYWMGQLAEIAPRDILVLVGITVAVLGYVMRRRDKKSV